MEAIDAFVNNLVMKKHAGAMDATAKEALREDIERWIEMAMLQALSDEQLSELERLTENGISDEELDDFLVGTGVDFTTVAEQALAEWRRNYLHDEKGGM